MKKDCHILLTQHIICFNFKQFWETNMRYFFVSLKRMFNILRLQELYHEMHALDRFEQDCRRKAQEEDNSSTAPRGNYLML